MDWYKTTLEIVTRNKGLFPITHLIESQIKKWEIYEGMCFLFIPHASASLVINEQYDPTAQKDLEEKMERLVPDLEPWYQHRMEGSDDSSSHIRSMLTSTSLSIPVDEYHLNLGLWQGVFIFEHRISGRKRMVYMRCLKVVQ